VTLLLLSVLVFLQVRSQVLSWNSKIGVLSTSKCSAHLVIATLATVWLSAMAAFYVDSDRTDDLPIEVAVCCVMTFVSAFALPDTTTTRLAAVSCVTAFACAFAVAGTSAVAGEVARFCAMTLLCTILIAVTSVGAAVAAAAVAGASAVVEAAMGSFRPRETTAKRYAESEANKSKTPLGMACTNGHLEIVRLLLAEAGVDANKASGRHPSTPLWCACDGGHTDVVQLLLTHADVDANKASGRHRTTPLTAACDGGHTDVVRLLLAHAGVDPG
jgi:hypothetical protein